ncbi:hypothetical protein G7072_00595 [Nocardioides sp. HDW12B]|uniref:hypothetical protein n=1 Tax=Nocardioides sp. HDW12B TaxID=2714939 RepID=UPI00140CD3C6|nr:hypothetical protein [Nocardioides sp. HDW12B]QIK65032.1 hypothetical protein G7072_00595 [Nocardioides sp. HDW12B]
MSTPPPPRRARHLMDPNAPRPVAGGPGSAKPGMSITSVQRWVLTALVVTTVEHFALAFVLGAASIDDSRVAERVVLLVLAAVVGVLGVVSAFLLHQRSPVSWWLPLGLLPALLGAAWVFSS